MEKASDESIRDELNVTSVTVTHLYVNTTIASLSGNMQKGLVHVKTRFEMEDNWAVKMRHRLKNEWICIMIFARSQHWLIMACDFQFREAV